MCLEVSAQLKCMSKGSALMLCDKPCRTAMQAIIDLTDDIMQQQELPFESKHGCLIGGYLALAKNWCSAKGPGNKLFSGEQAAKVLWDAVKEAPAGDRLCMKLAPYSQLLMPDTRKLLLKKIEGMLSSGAGLKRLGSKAALGMVKCKKVAASASASSKSGATLKVSIFD